MLEEEAVKKAIAYRIAKKNSGREVYSWVCDNCGDVIFSNWHKKRSEFNVCGIECEKSIKRERYSGENGNRWSGGRVLRNGYVLVYDPDRARAGQNKYVSEHKVVMEKKIGRRLVKGESVHHKNGIRSDNRSENLELWRAQPAGQRVSDLIEYVSRYHFDKVLEFRRNV